MARRALYREYRPETFQEVIGQDHITTILKNQVREGKLSHAYLFCGSRGTGKTTSAKILSRAANCLSPEDGEPCGKCAACRLTAAGSADVIEIDAASNNSVDNVRSLIEQAQFAPLELKYRVFIIDEVHMLSNAAFNALLKTLEEPPKHVLFILATTEPQKLPATIISRCQRFDFHRLTIAHIVANLTAVLQKAGASIEPNGLRLIARAAEGGMRDALSLADQCLSYAGNDVSEQDVLDALGTVSAAALEETAAALLAGDAASAVRALDEVVRNGRDLGVFLNDLSRHFRALLLAKTCGECADLLDCTDDQMQRYLKTAKNADEARILYAMEQLLAVQGKLRLFPSPRIPIETAFVRVCRPEDDLSLGALEARVAVLESRPVSAAPVPEKPKEENAPTDLPPWEEPAPIPVKSEPAVVESVQKQEPVQVPEPEPVESGRPAGGEAAEIWEKTKKKISEMNPMVFFYVRESRGIALSGDVLTVEFPAAKESMMNGMKAARNLKIANDAMHEVRPGTELSFRLETLANENEEKLKELFGSALTIK